MKVLVTGGAGFLGWHTVAALLASDRGREVVNLDLLTYAGSRKAVRDLDVRFPGRHHFIRGDIRDPATVERAMTGVRAVVHLAAETHVDRSIVAPEPFISTNVMGTQVLLDAARAHGVERFLHASTDEVYGQLPLSTPEGSLPRFTEESPVAPRSPYAASKAAADHLVLAAYHTHGLPVVITRGSNAYGPAQYPEKLIPRAIRCLGAGRAVPVYGTGQQVREWVHAGDQARGFVLALERGRPGRIYNLGGGEPRSNLVLLGELLSVMGAPEDAVEHVSDRPGHDQRYAMDGSRAGEELGWRPSATLADALPRVVEWYRGRGVDWWDAEDPEAP
ncbi:MAG: dTDP-glucose 4,6-dehydratase [Gemmatimonadota bacterium]